MIVKDHKQNHSRSLIDRTIFRGMIVIVSDWTQLGLLVSISGGTTSFLPMYHFKDLWIVTAQTLSSI